MCWVAFPAGITDFWHSALPFGVSSVDYSSSNSNDNINNNNECLSV